MEVLVRAFVLLLCELPKSPLPFGVTISFGKVGID
jgi:hypothetical protein